MAKLTQKQAAKQVEDEKAKREALKKKREIQRNKELYGENWKKILENNMVQDMEMQIGSDKAPKVFDSFDVYELFDPIIMYRSKEGKALNMDVEQFEKSEAEYEEAIRGIHEKLKQCNGMDEKYFGDGVLSDDGISEFDNAKPKSGNKEDNESEGKEVGGKGKKKVVTDTDRRIADLKEKHEGSNITAEEQAELNRLVNEKTKGKISEVKQKFLSTVGIYFGRFFPVYNKYVCSCCGTPKNLKDYYIVYDISCAGRIDEKGNCHMAICKECVNKLLAYYYKKYDKDIEKAMISVCASTNLYWDEDLFVQAQRLYEEGSRQGTLVGGYVKLVNSVATGKVWVDSEWLGERRSEISSIETIRVDVPYDWSKEDYQNRAQVISIMGRDPFQNEEDEETKKTLYSDFLSITDDDINNDYIKKMSAVSIVKGFDTIRKLEDKLSRMEKENAPLSEQKAVSALRDSALKSITEFSSQNGLIILAPITSNSYSKPF